MSNKSDLVMEDAQQVVPPVMNSPETTVAHSPASGKSVEADHDQSSAMKDQCIKEETSSPPLVSTEGTTSLLDHQDTIFLAPQESFDEQRKRKRSSDEEEFEEGEIPSSPAESETMSKSARNIKNKKLKGISEASPDEDEGGTMAKMERISEGNLDEDDDETTAKLKRLSEGNPDEDDDGSTEKRLHPSNYCDKVFDTWQGLGGHQNAHKKERIEIRDRETIMRLAMSAVCNNKNPLKFVVGPGGIRYFVGAHDVVNNLNHLPPLNNDIVEGQQQLAAASGSKQLPESRRTAPPINNQLTTDQDNRRRAAEEANNNLVEIASPQRENIVIARPITSIDDNNNVNSRTAIISGFRSDVGRNDPLIISTTGLDLFTFKAAPKMRSDDRNLIDLKFG